MCTRPHGSPSTGDSSRRCAWVLPCMSCFSRRHGSHGVPVFQSRCSARAVLEKLLLFSSLLFSSLLRVLRVSVRKPGVESHSQHKRDRIAATEVRERHCGEDFLTEPRRTRRSSLPARPRRARPKRNSVSSPLFSSLLFSSPCSPCLREKTRSRIALAAQARSDRRHRYPRASLRRGFLTEPQRTRRSSLPARPRRARPKRNSASSLLFSSLLFSVRNQIPSRPLTAAGSARSARRSPLRYLPSASRSRDGRPRHRWSRSDRRRG